MDERMQTRARAETTQGSLFGKEAPASGRSPLVYSVSGGVDSTAVIVESHRRGIRPDLQLFADTGGEKPSTYAYLRVLDRFCAEIGFPPIITVRYRVQRPVFGHYDTLEQEVLLHGKLPSLAYGSHTCSHKWKVSPQQAHIEGWEPARRAWRQGLPVIQMIGFDASPHDSRRCGRLPDDDPRYEFYTPLIEWSIDRAKAIEIIRDCELLARIACEMGVDPVPEKSACFFCPATKPEEVVALAAAHPDLARRAMQIERNAAPNLTTTEGLFRKATKTRPGSWTELLTGEALPVAGPDAVDEIRDRRTAARAAAVCRAGQEVLFGRTDVGAASANASDQAAVSSTVG